MKDYLEAIKENIQASKWEMEDMEDTLLIPRIALVMYGMHCSLDINDGEGCFRWSNDVEEKCIKKASYSSRILSPFLYLYGIQKESA